MNRKEKVKTEYRKFASAAIDLLVGYLCLAVTCFLVYLSCSKELTVILEAVLKNPNILAGKKILLFGASFCIYGIYYCIHTVLLDIRGFRKRSKPVGEETLCKK